jgi:hypothetical protein
MWLPAPSLTLIAPSWLPQAGFEDPSTNDRLNAIQKAFQQSVAATNLSKYQSTHRHYNDTSVNASESLPYLPSTVSDSQAVGNVEQILQEIPGASVPQVIEALKKMNSQSVPQDTQPISPEYIEGLLKSKRSTAYDEETGFTHGTLHPGDEGHIDLLSSYQQDAIVVEEEDELEPVEVDFSPTQSIPNPLPQYPESQRFKTPATVSKKRNYNGDVVETPALPRNPLARNGQPTPRAMMGLSQAFAGTQAASSPFLNGLPSEIRSDRPSPALKIQPRPTTAADSSPLQSLPGLPRRSIEPQTKYISMEESQARRDAQKRLEMEEAEESQSSDDSFNETPAEVVRRREKKRRDDEARRQFDAVSRARMTRQPYSSPIRSSRISPIGSSPLQSPIRAVSRGLLTDPTSPPEVPDEATNESEEETEQEDEDEVAVRLSSQLQRRAVPEEDKENAPQCAVQIPHTTELHRVMRGHAPEVESSPSTRHGIDFARSHPGSQRPPDEDAVVVANSQPSQKLRTTQASQKTRWIIGGPRSSGEHTDFVPQSQYPSNSTPEGSRGLGTLNERNTRSPLRRDAPDKPILLISKSDGRSSVAETAEDVLPLREGPDDDVDDEEPPRRNLRSQAVAHTLQSTIPETSSARLRGGHSFSTDQRGEITKSTGDFETAPTHPPASSNEHDSAPAALPSQATVNVSPLHKRKRMDEIDAEESQQRSSAPHLGELNPLQMDAEYRDTMGNPSPLRAGRYTKNRRLESSPLKPRQRINSSPIAPSNNSRPNGSMEKEVADEQEPIRTQGETPPPSSDDIISGPRTRGLSRPLVSGHAKAVKHFATYRKAKTKPSAWDIQASPEMAVQTRSAPRAMNLRRPPSTLPPANNGAASASSLPRAATQHTKAAEEQEVTSLASTSRHSRAKARLHDPVPETSAPQAITRTTSTLVRAAKDHKAPSGDVVAPNQVLACYNGKSRAYYPATCIGVSGTETLRYQIQWDGYEPDEIDEHGVRNLDLRHGDSLKINLEGFPRTAHVIRGFKDKVTSNENAITDIRGYKTLLVVPKQRKSLPVDANIVDEQIVEVPVSAVYLDTVMWNQMKDRHFAYVAPSVLPPSTTPSGFATPIERSSTPSTPGSRSRRPPASTALTLSVYPTTGNGRFANMAFAISYDSTTRKSELTSLIESNGGLILPSSFQQLFLPDQLVLKPQYANLGFTALLADKHSKKEKYLQALALGLPCLSGKWIEACISAEELVDWPSYLLPAGESEELEGAIRSRILSVYDPAIVRLADVVQNARPNILDSASIIFVLGRGEKRRPYVFLTRALGAERIEKVSDLRAAKVLLEESDGKEYKWVFVDDGEVETATAQFTKSGRGSAKSPSMRVVGNEFVKQSLVLGKMFGG